MQQKESQVTSHPLAELQKYRKYIKHITRYSLKDWLEPLLVVVNEGYARLIICIRYPVIHRVVRRIRAGEAVYHCAYRYIHQMNLLKRFAPLSILEFGSGISTGVFAAYARRSGARILTIEDSQVWLENTKKALGEMARLVELKWIPSRSKRGDPGRCYYDFTGKEKFDMVFVDGPPLTVDGKKDGSAINSNVIDMIESGLAPKTILIDERDATAQYIAARYSDLYEPFFREKKQHFLGYRYHSYFILRGKR